MARLSIGLKDRDGKEIFDGDIVEFFFCADCGGIQDAIDSCNHPPTRCVDEVVSIDHGDGRRVAYFRSPGFGSAYAWRYNEKSRVIGSLPGDREMFWAQNPDGLNSSKNG